MKSFVFLVVFSSLLFLSTPSEALAVMMSLNSKTGQNQTFQNDSNVTISSSNNTHSLGWLGLLPISRGGTGVGSFTAGSLLFFNGTNFAQDNSNLFWDNTNKRLGIGTASPTGQIHLGGSGQAITNDYGLLISDKTAGTNNYNIWSGPLLSDFDQKVQSEFSNLLGKNVFTEVNGPFPGTSGIFLTQATSSDANALESASFVTTGGISAFGINANGYSIAPSGQTVPSVVGLYTQSQNAGTGTVSELLGVAVDSNTNTDTGITTNNYGIQISDQFAGANNYSLYTNQSSGGDNYALYNAGPAKSYFAGNVGIGTTAVTSSLDVVGTIKGNSTIVLGVSSTPACIEMADSDGSGVTYITANDGVLTASSTKPSFCQ